MSEKSFAVASVSVAIVWGTFFYPPTPSKTSGADIVAPVAAGVSVERLRLDKASLGPAPLSAPERPAAVKTALGSQSATDCTFAGTRIPAGCAPLHKLAGD